MLPDKTITPSNALQASCIQLQEAEEQRNLGGAEKICESLLRRHPDYVAALHSLGLINLDKCNYERAARAHIAWYNEMMDLLAAKLPDIVRVIRYEDMVADPVTVLRIAANLCGIPMQHGPLPQLGDDRGCAAPYREFMASESAKHQDCH